MHTFSYVRGHCSYLITEGIFLPLMSHNTLGQVVVICQSWSINLHERETTSVLAKRTPPLMNKRETCASARKKDS